MPPQSCLTSSTVYLARLRSSVGLMHTCLDTFSSILSREGVRQLHAFVYHVSRISVAHRIKHSETVRHSCFNIGGKPVRRAVSNARSTMLCLLCRRRFRTRVSKGSCLFLKSLLKELSSLIAEILLLCWRTVRLNARRSNSMLLDWCLVFG